MGVHTDSTVDGVVAIAMSANGEGHGQGRRGWVGADSSGGSSSTSDAEWTGEG